MSRKKQAFPTSDVMDESVFEPGTQFRWMLEIPGVDLWCLKSITLPSLKKFGEYFVLSDSEKGYTCQAYMTHRIGAQLTQILGTRVDKVELKFLSSLGSVIQKYTFYDCKFDNQLMYNVDELTYNCDDPIIYIFNFDPKKISIC